MFLKSDSYPASLEIDYPIKLSRLTTLLRIFLAIPIIIILTLIISGGGTGPRYENKTGNEEKTSHIENTTDDDVTTYTVRTENIETSGYSLKTEVATDGLGVLGGLTAATALMILFRRRYPRWWFDFNLELNRFITRVCAYLFLMTDKYPSTVEEQTVHLGLKYPNAEKDLNRWLPLVKWLLALPHYIVLIFLMIGAFFAVVIAWFAILLTGRYPKGLFDFVVGVMRWNWRVNAYAFLLTTDRYPQFSLK